MMLLNSFFRRIIKDLRQKELMPLKLIFFVQTSTLYILYPYLTIHMRELGINVEETAIMSAITPFVAIIMPPLAGLIADRIGNFKILLSMFSSFGGAAALLLLLVPVGRVTVQLPEQVVLSASCPGGGGGGGELLYSMSQQHPCDTLLEARLDASLQSCGYACPMASVNEAELQAALLSQNYKLSVYEPKSSRNLTYQYAISESDMPQKSKLPADVREIRKLQNMEYYKIAIRQLSANVLFFPAHKPQLFDLACEPSEADNLTTCGFDALQAQEAASFRTYLKALKLSEQDTAEKRRRYLVQSLEVEGRGNRSTRCPAAGVEAAAERVSVQIELRNSTSDEVYEVLTAEGCTRSCLLTAPRKDICTNPKMQIEYNIRLTFWAYLAIRVFIGMIGGTSFAMFEGAVIAILREQKADYGLQRIYGSIGGMISSPLSGMLIDYASGNKGYTDFRPAFYLYAAMKIFSGVLMMLINLEFKAPAKNIVSDVVTVLKNVEVVALLIACFILGTAWGYIESFLFWLLQDLGASRSLMGITITVGGIAGIPLLVLSGPIISRIGHANVLFIGFVFYAIRLLGYSLIYDPWLCLIFEALESVTSSLSFTAAVTYAAKLSTTTTDSSIQGLLGGLYYGVGKGCGSLIGGYLMKAFGTRPTYQIFSVVTLITGLVYLLFNLTYLAKRPQVEGNDIVKKKPKVKVDLAAEKSTIQELEESKARKEKELESEPYIIDDIEAINNAKNLDIVETINAEEVSEEEQNKDVENNTEDNSNQLRQRHTQPNGSVNPAFIDDSSENCKVTVEKEPKEPKK